MTVEYCMPIIDTFILGTGNRIFIADECIFTAGDVFLCESASELKYTWTESQSKKRGRIHPHDVPGAVPLHSQEQRCGCGYSVSPPAGCWLHPSAFA